MNKQELTKNARELISAVFIFDSTSIKKPGEFIKKFGHRFPLKEFKAEHFNHNDIIPLLPKLTKEQKLWKY